MLCFKEKSKLLQPTATTTYACPPITSLRNSNSLTTTWQKTRQQQKEKQGCRLSRRPGQRLIFHFFKKFSSRCGFGVMHSLFHLNQSFKFTVFSKAFCSSFKMYCFFPWKVRFFLRSEKSKKKFIFLEFMQEIYIYTYLSISMCLYIDRSIL